MAICVSITCMVSSKYSDQLLNVHGYCKLGIFIINIIIIYLLLLCSGGTVCVYGNITNSTHTQIHYLINLHNGQHLTHTHNMFM